MSDISDQLRQMVQQRARGVCEYCHLPQALQAGTFHIDHIVPRSLNGETTAENLALACPNCNARTWAYVEAVDPSSREVARLFNPRSDQWAEHFRWAPDDDSLLEGATACGRATVSLLQINVPNLRLIRQLLARLGHPVI